MQLVRYMYMGWMTSIISSYKNIAIRPQSLYVFDIDDTLLHFPEFPRAWWKETTQKYKAICEATADDKAHDEWMRAVELRPGFACDKEGFLDIYHKILDSDGKVILLTARPASMKDLTLRHLREGLWEFDPGHVYFDKEKGQRLRKIVEENYKDVHHITFVDDYEKNIESVRNAFLGSEKTLDTYLYVHHV